jgi:hypothetical protein
VAQEHLADRRVEAVPIIAAIIKLGKGPVPRLARQFANMPK